MSSNYSEGNKADVYEFEKIIQAKLKSNDGSQSGLHWEYLVKWKGWEPSHNSHVDETEFQDQTDLAEFWDQFSDPGMPFDTTLYPGFIATPPKVALSTGGARTRTILPLFQPSGSNSPTAVSPVDSLFTEVGIPVSDKQTPPSEIQVVPSPSKPTDTSSPQVIPLAISQYSPLKAKSWFIKTPSLSATPQELKEMNIDQIGQMNSKPKSLPTANTGSVLRFKNGVPSVEKGKYTKPLEEFLAPQREDLPTSVGPQSGSNNMGQWRGRNSEQQRGIKNHTPFKHQQGRDKHDFQPHGSDQGWSGRKHHSGSGNHESTTSGWGEFETRHSTTKAKQDNGSGWGSSATGWGSDSQQESSAGWGVATSDSVSWGAPNQQDDSTWASSHGTSATSGWGGWGSTTTTSGTWGGTADSAKSPTWGPIQNAGSVGWSNTVDQSSSMQHQENTQINTSITPVAAETRSTIAVDHRHNSRAFVQPDPEFANLGDADSTTSQDTAMPMQEVKINLNTQRSRSPTPTGFEELEMDVPRLREYARRFQLRDFFNDLEALRSLHGEQLEREMQQRGLLKAQSVC